VSKACQDGLKSKWSEMARSQVFIDGSSVGFGSRYVFIIFKVQFQVDIW